MTWSAQQYVKYEDERTRPVRDLLAGLPAVEVRTAVDLGCGPGNSTELLTAHFPGAKVSGIDSSPEMIDAARLRLPRLHFEVADIAQWVAEGVARGGSGHDAAASRVGFILANAVLHWLPDHASLFPALAARLAPGGGLAVQMPDNLDQPAHRLMRKIASDGPWAGKLSFPPHSNSPTASAAARSSLGSADWYYQLLAAAGCTVEVWRTTYYHALREGAAGVVEWFKGSGLRPFIEPLDADERMEFLARYETAVARAYPALADGSVLLPFPRLFIVAVR